MRHSILTTTDGTNRKAQLLTTLRAGLAQLLEVEEREVDVHERLIEMGADSLVLVGAIRNIQGAFGVKIEVRQLFEDLSTLDALATYLDRVMPPDAGADLAQLGRAADVPAPPVPHAPAERPTAIDVGPTPAFWDGTPGVPPPAVSLPAMQEPLAALRDEPGTLAPLLMQQLTVLSQVILEQLRLIDALAGAAAPRAQAGDAAPGLDPTSDPPHHRIAPLRSMPQEVDRPPPAAALADGEAPEARGLREDGPYASAGPSGAAPSEDGATAAPTAILRFPLTAEQRVVWKSEELDSGALAIKPKLAVRLRGPFDPDALRRSFQRTVDRHEALRTIFTGDGREAIVFNRMTLDVPFVDLSGLPPQAREARICDVMIAESRLVLDRTRGPLLHVQLFKLAEDEHILVASSDHLVADGYSMAVLLRDVARFYRADRAGQPLELPPPMRFSEYAAWRTAWLEGPGVADARAFWTRHLEGAVGRLDLPYDRAPTRPRNDASDHEVMTLGPAVTVALARFSRDQQCTPFMLLLTAFKTLLHRLSGNDDIVVGIPLAARSLRGCEEMFGSCVNLGAIRTQINDDPTFAEYLRTVRGAVLDAVEHEGFPLAQLTRPPDPCLNPAATSRLYGVYFNVEVVPGDVDLGCEIELLPFPVDYCHPDIFFNIIGFGQQLLLDVSYSTTVLDAQTVRRWMSHFSTLLEQALSDPATPLSRLPMLSAAELEELLATTRDEAAGSPPPSIVELVEARARRAPDERAIEVDAESLTYGELDRRADELARLLAARGVSPGGVVGLGLEHLADRVVGMLAVLKTGGAFLPLDPSSPVDRLADALRTAAASALVARGGLTDAEAGCACIDLDVPFVPPEPTAWTPRRSIATDAACLLQPANASARGAAVVVSQAALSSVVGALQTVHRLREGERVLHAAPAGTATAVWGCLWPLSVGAALVSLPDGTAEFAKWLAAHPGETLVLETSLLRTFLEADGLADCVFLTRVLCGGGPVTPEIQEQFFSRLRAELHGHYGPLEMCGAAASWTYEDEVDRRSARIGQPLDGAELYVFDRHLSPTPIGVPGELYVGGSSLSHPYVGRADSPSERFVDHPRSARPGARLLRTGELARHLPDGSFESLGRVDNQVRVGGFRTDLSDVEEAVRGHPLARDVAIALRQTDPRNERLVAYVAVDSPQPHMVADLRRHYRDSRPDSMVIPEIVLLTALPRTPSGEPDWSALPAPGPGSSQRATGYVAPRDPLERELTALWEEVLDVHPIGLLDDFFELGGHSLLLVHLVDRVQDHYKRPLPLAILANEITVVRMASVLRSARSALPAGRDAVAKMLFGADPGAGRDAPPESAAEHSFATPVDLKAEAVLDPEIRALAPVEHIGAPACLLLTGATGFIGAFLLHELLLQTDAKIYLLVRAATPEEAMQRLTASLSAYSLWDPRFAPRLAPLLGDLSRPLLGLQEARFHALAHEVDGIFHNGAFVNLVSSYASLKSANVLGTQEILRLAANGKTKPVHYVSTLGVFPTIVQPGTVFREDPLDQTEGVWSGYSESKWVADRLVAIAGSRGLPVCTYRLGRVTGDSRSGVCKTNDLWCAAIKACVRLRCAPDVSGTTDVVPVDFVSRALVHIASQPASLGKVFHLCNPERVEFGELGEALASCGYPIERVPFSEWWGRLLEQSRRWNSNALALIERMHPDIVEHMMSFGPHFDCTTATQALAGSSIVCPRADRQLFRTYFEHFVRCGFLEAPPVPAPDTRPRAADTEGAPAV